MTEDSTFYTMDDFDHSIHELRADLKKENELVYQALGFDESSSFLKHYRSEKEIRAQFYSRKYT